VLEFQERHLLVVEEEDQVLTVLLRLPLALEDQAL
jgi:hypothetical protein